MELAELANLAAVAVMGIATLLVPLFIVITTGVFIGSRWWMALERRTSTGNLWRPTARALGIALGLIGVGAVVGFAITGHPAGYMGGLIAMLLLIDAYPWVLILYGVISLTTVVVVSRHLRARSARLA